MTVNEAVLSVVMRELKELGTIIVRVSSVEDALKITRGGWAERDGYYLVALLTIKEKEEESEKETS